MATSLKSVYGGGSSRVDGFPPVPSPADVKDLMGSTRYLSILGTTSSIFLPPSPTGTTTSLGYKRVDHSVGTSEEWLVSWNEITTFLGAGIGDLTDGAYSRNSQILGNYLYIGFQDILKGVDGVHSYSYLVKINISTGVIESADPIIATPTTITYGTAANNSREKTFDGTDQICTWWEVLPTGELECWYNRTTSSQTHPGFAKIVYSSDLTSVVSEEIYYDTSLEGGTNSLQFVKYVSESGNIVLLEFEGSALVYIVSTDQAVFLPISANIRGSVDTVFTISDLTPSLMLTGDVTALARTLTDSVNEAYYINTGITTPYVDRSEIDNYLVQLVHNFSGVTVA